MTNILTSIDAEIAHLQEARELLADTGISTRSKATSTHAAPKRNTGKRVMSAEAREKIAAAQRKRWAAQKKRK